MSRDSAQLQLEASLSRLIAGGDGAVACHLMGLDDTGLQLLKDRVRASEATVAVWVALNDRLGYALQPIPPEVLETFIELLETERELEAQRRSGGGGWYEPTLAAAMSGYLRAGKEGLRSALEQFPVLSDYEQDRFLSASGEQNPLETN